MYGLMGAGFDSWFAGGLLADAIVSGEGSGVGGGSAAVKGSAASAALFFVWSFGSGAGFGSGLGVEARGAGGFTEASAPTFFAVRGSVVKT